MSTHASDLVDRPDTLGRWIGLWDVLIALGALLASFLVLRLTIVPELYEQATDKAYFSRSPLLLDVQRQGYTFDTVRDHLRALGEHGRAYYADAFIPIYDLAFSLFLLTFAIIFILYATQRGRDHALDVSPFVRRLMLVPSALMFLLDVGENLSVRTLMTEYPRISPKLVETASMFTELKWDAVFATTLVIMALAVHTLYRMLAGERRAAAKG